MVTSSLRCFYTRKAFTQLPNHCFRGCQLSSFGLQPTSRFGPDAASRLGTRKLPGFHSLSAPSLFRRDEKRSPSNRSPLRGFRTLSAGSVTTAQLVGLFHPTGTRRVMTFKALPQSDPVLSSSHRASSPLPASHGFLLDSDSQSRLHNHRGLSVPAIPSKPSPLILLRGSAPITGLGRP